MASADDLKGNSGTKLKINRMIGDTHRAATELMGRNAVIEHADFVVLKTTPFRARQIQTANQQTV